MARQAQADVSDPQVDDVTSVIPLRLAGGAIAVYSQLPLEHERNPAKVKEALRTAFEVDSVAYEQLAGLFGGMSDKALACAFVAGLPGSIRQLLRAGSRMENLSLDDIVGVLKDDFPVSYGDACLGAMDLHSVSITNIFQTCKIFHYKNSTIKRNTMKFIE
uniref:Uncharacterized protein n=1 Tax=Trichuris muris TaxID=70415 RepID=A0A5S6QWG8_TRIMR